MRDRDVATDYWSWRCYSHANIANQCRRTQLCVFCHWLPETKPYLTASHTFFPFFLFHQARKRRLTKVPWEYFAIILLKYQTEKFSLMSLKKIVVFFNFKLLLRMQRGKGLRKKIIDKLWGTGLVENFWRWFGCRSCTVYVSIGLFFDLAYELDIGGVQLNLFKRWLMVSQKIYLQIVKSMGMSHVDGILRLAPLCTLRHVVNINKRHYARGGPISCVRRGALAPGRCS